MSSPDPLPIYSVDSSSFMDWQARFYPADVFTGLVQKIEALIADGRLRAPVLVREEIEAVGTAGLIQWAQNQTDVFVPTAEVLVDAQTIQNQFPGLRDPKAEFEEADAYVIALARSRSGIVVTQRPLPLRSGIRNEHTFIPDVCRELGVPCISLLGLIRRERWNF